MVYGLRLRFQGVGLVGVATRFGHTQNVTLGAARHVRTTLHRVQVLGCNVRA